MLLFDSFSSMFQSAIQKKIGKEKKKERKVKNTTDTVSASFLINLFCFGVVAVPISLFFFGIFAQKGESYRAEYSFFFSNDIYTVF